jgi:hypothetical protein
MELTGIKTLYKEMKESGEYRQQFDFCYNKTDARVLFLIDINPYLLCFSAIGRQKYFQVELQRGFLINTYLDPDTLNRLRDVFNIGRTKSGEFSTKEFFRFFNTHIPQHIKHTKKVRPEDVAPHIRGNIEESNKIYFWRFRVNGVNEHVSEMNLDKTKALLGKEAYQMCRKNNISTQWTDQHDEDTFDAWKQMLIDKTNGIQKIPNSTLNA